MKLLKKFFLHKSIIAAGCLILLSIFFIGAPAKAETKEDLQKAGWIFLQIKIPYPGCSGGTAGEVRSSVKCCTELRSVEGYDSESSCPTGTIGAIKDAPALIVVALQFGIIVLAILLFFLLIVGGFYYIVSGGSSKGASTGKTLMKNATISLVVLLFSSVILYQINPNLTNLTIPEVKPVAFEANKCADAYSQPCGTLYKNNLCRGTSCNNTQACKVEIGTDGKPVQVKVNDTPTVSYKCQPLSEIGELCDNNGDCSSSQCNQGRCVASTLGSSCTSSSDCGGLICNDKDNTCAYGMTGSPCDSDQGCAQGFACQSAGRNFCVPLKGAHYQACDDTAQCPDGDQCIVESNKTLLVLGTTATALVGVSLTAGSGGLATGAAVAGTILVSKQIASVSGQASCWPTLKSDPTTLAKFTCDISSCESQNADMIKEGFDDKSLNKCYDGTGLLNHYCTTGLPGTWCNNGDDCLGLASGAKGYCNTNGQNVCTTGGVGERCSTDITAGSSCQDGLVCDPDNKYCIHKK